MRITGKAACIEAQGWRGAMIGKLKGVIDSYGEDFIVLDVAGVGYLVHCSARTLQALPAAGEAAHAVDRDPRARGSDPAVRLPQRRRARMVPPAADRAGRRRQGRALGARHAQARRSRLAIAMRDKAAIARARASGRRSPSASSPS
jgi:Holliday junction DNA helicase RuvA